MYAVHGRPASWRPNALIGTSRLGVRREVRHGGSIQAIFVAVTLAACAAAAGDEVVRRELEPGAYAMVKQGRNVGLELHTARGGAAQEAMRRYLLDPADWTVYASSSVTFVPFEALNAPTRRAVLLSVYTRDYVDEHGWVHVVMDERETLWSLCEWLTGSGKTYTAIMEHPSNRLRTTPLVRGQQVRIPREFLLEGLHVPTPERIPEKSANNSPAVPRGSSPDGLLEYGSDRRGEYAKYVLKPGEALYTSVVARFTDMTDNAAVLAACDIIADRSGIRDVRDIDAGREILIPAEILADKYKPRNDPARRNFEATVREAARIRREQAAVRDLSDVVVILDAGHGGSDTGAMHAGSGLYEDEINYDIMCRIKGILERDTGAVVYTTIYDKSSGYAPADAKRFRHDEDEVLNTNPHYSNDLSSSVSANLRWMIANSIYDRELRKGVSPEHVIFTSIHTDSLYNSNMRGAMIYIPGANLRRAEEVRTNPVYARYEEGRSFNRFTSTRSELTRDEAMSMNFANVLLHELGERRIKRHSEGDPIRNQIRRSRTRVFVPAVIRNTKVPTKVLVETANLNNATDRQRLADPWWREEFAKAYVDALRVYYKAPSDSFVAQAD